MGLVDELLSAGQLQDCVSPPLCSSTQPWSPLPPRPVLVQSRHHRPPAVLLGESHQLLQLLARGGRAGGVVGGAEEDDVGALDLLRVGGGNSGDGVRYLQYGRSTISVNRIATCMKGSSGRSFV